MIIYTSYYAMISRLPKDYAKISISRYMPDFFPKVENTYWIEELAPTPELMDVAKKLNDREQYIRRYKEERLSILDPHKVAESIGHNGVILCYEKTGDFCHRHLVADWLRIHGYDVREYPFSKGDI